MDARALVNGTADPRGAPIPGGLTDGRGAALPNGAFEKTARLKFSWNFTLDKFLESAPLYEGGDIKKCLVSALTEPAIQDLVDPTDASVVPMRSIIITHVALESIENTSAIPFIVKAPWIPRAVHVVSSTGQVGVASVPAAAVYRTPDYVIYDIKADAAANQYYKLWTTPAMLSAISYKSVEELQSAMCLDSNNELRPCMATHQTDPGMLVLAGDSAIANVVQHVMTVNSPAPPQQQHPLQIFVDLERGNLGLPLMEWTAAKAHIAQYFAFRDYLVTNLTSGLMCTLAFDVHNNATPNPTSDVNITRAVAGHFTSRDEYNYWQKAGIRVSVVFNVQYLVPYKLAK
jgi:hypothetical protein